MTETPPCGICGRPLGPFVVERGPLRYNVWRHLETAGLVPHAAVIGTPGRRATVEQMTEALGDGEAARELWDHIYGKDAKPKRVHLKLEEIPAPRVPARPANDDETPAPAKSLRNLALEHGWEVRVVYAIGPVISVGGHGAQVIREVESVSVRMRRGGQRLVSIWERQWTPQGPPILTKRKQCAGCKSLDCEGCQLGTGATEEKAEARWEHDGSWAATPTTSAVKLSDVKDAVRAPEAYCGSCSEVLGNHVPDPRAGMVCPVQSA